MPSRLPTRLAALLSLFLLLPLPFATAQVTEADSMALVTIYNRMGGPNWTNNSGWLQDRVGNWFGISAANNRVSRIDLTGNGVTGSIPAAIGQLTHVDTLAFTANNLTGVIPPEIGDVDSLRFLLLPNNALTGAIPKELGQLSALEFMALAGNNLSGSLPAELGQLKNLVNLDLFRNQLEGSIPAELGDLEKLELLFLTSNRITGPIPSELGQLANLRTLHLSGNQLEGALPSTLGDMPLLRVLDVSFNNLNGQLPESLGALSKLEVLWIFNNLLEGTLPAALGDLAILKSFNLSNTNLTGNIPESFIGMEMLNSLNYRNTTVCSPIGTPLQAWLDGIGTLTSNGMSCEPTSNKSVDELPNVLVVAPHFPNPARAATNIRYRLPASGHVKIVLYDAQGKRMQQYSLGSQAPGWHETTLNFADLPRGTYWYQLLSGTFTATRSIVLH